MKYILTILFALFLGACNTSQPTVVTRTEYRVVEIPESILQCVRVSKDTLPDPDKLTDVQIARLIRQLWKNNETCANNMNAIREFIRKSKETIENNR